MSSSKSYFRKVEFHHFKALQKYRIDLRDFNILVGPNNAGKSTVITAFRILAAALRKANSRKPEIVTGPQGQTRGYSIDLRSISVAEENIFYNYDDSEPAHIRFTLSNDNVLTLFFAEQGACTLIADAAGKVIDSPTSFRTHFDCGIGFVPILGPVEHREPLFEKEAARLALFSYRAARNFRNIWFHYPDRFEQFQELLRQTWPGMDILPPEVEFLDKKPHLFMYCPEKRIPREIFWAGFGFQVWCQMLTHLIQSADESLFLIDEPDVYLHSDLQRQLLDILRNLGPDILIATHSTEIITEANPDEIVIVDKERPRSRRIQDPTKLGGIFSLLGSNLNPILTQLAKTKRVLFVEGKDFQVLGRFARRLGSSRIGNRADFAVVPIDGFNPEKMKNLKAGMEATLGSPVVSCAILDRDYRSSAECKLIENECRKLVDYVSIHKCKELENFLLVPDAIDRAIARRIAARPDRAGREHFQAPWAKQKLSAFAKEKRSYVTSQYLGNARSFERVNSPGKHETQVNQGVLDAIESDWDVEQLQLIPGKDALSFVNEQAQKAFGVSVTPAAVIDAMTLGEIPDEMKKLVAQLQEFTGRRSIDTTDDLIVA